MKLDIHKEMEAPLLARKRVTLIAEFEGATPSRKDLLKEVAKKLKSDEKLTVIRHIYSKFGRQKAKVIVNVYENADAMKHLEEDSFVKKHVAADGQKEGSGAPAEEKKAQTSE